MRMNSDSGDRRELRAVAESASEVAMKLLAMLGLGPSPNGRNGSAPEGSLRANGNGTAKNLDPRTQRQIRKLIDACRNLLGERGESSGVRLATEALALYRGASAEGRKVFYDTLGTEFSPDPAEAAESGLAYRDDPTADNLARLRRSTEAPRELLFQGLNMAPGGTAELVAMRGDLLKGYRQNPLWEGPGADLGHLFSSWFNRGFLKLRRIDWQTSASVLEKLIRYEAVHEIQGWPDLRRRLEADRRCYAFFHPALPDEPIVFIEVALTRGMSSTVQPLLDPMSPVADPGQAKCAVFYSITNCHEGLRGVPFGSFLIKQVAAELGRELPKLKRFVTLSPMPGFRKWLIAHPRFDALGLKTLGGEVLGQNPPDGAGLRERMQKLENQLMPLAAYYLLNAKRHGKPVDSVARFHLRNGARLERINWMGNSSPVGFEQSLGLMVNYEYRLQDVERNHERYARHGDIAASAKVEVQADRCELAEEDHQKARARKGQPAA